MKNLLSLMCLLLATSAFAVNPDNLSSKFETSVSSIDAELNQLQEINTLVLENNLSFDELNVTHADLVAETNLSASAADGIFEGHRDAPAGIPGFWWGFCLGWVGMLVIYLTMDEGSGRKEQVMNALWGCIIANVVGIVLWFAFVATIFATNN